MARRAEFEAALGEGRFDLVLADNSLPGFSGLEALRLCRRRAPDVPFIFVSGTLGEEVAIHSLQEGATDYVLKERLARLAPAVRRAIEEAAQLRVRREAEEALRREKEHTAHIVAAAPALICGIGPDGTTRFVNPAVTQCTGYEASALVGSNWWQLLFPGSDYSEVEGPLAVMKRGEARDYEVALTTAGGEKRIVSWNFVSRFDESDRLVETVGIGIDITDRHRAEERLQHASLHDALTGLPNRTLFMDRLTHAAARERRRTSGFTVLLLGIDRFKAINDSFGHVVGDALLSAAAERIAASLRPGDTLARLGSDEFGALLEEVAPDEGLQAARRVEQELRRPFEVAGHEIFLTASVGLVRVRGGRRAQDVLRDADIVLARALLSGSGAIVEFDESMRDEVVRRQRLESDLHKAIAQGQLFVVYQPIVSLRDGRMAGVEALVRWRHPEHGLLGAPVFVPLAEETGLIVDLDEAVLREACADVSRWRALGLAADLKVNVNLSGHDFSRPEFVGRLERVLGQCALPRGVLRVEITESVLLQDAETTRSAVSQLHAQGVELVLDDFGTGYSSLSYLHRFPLAGLKIDRSFVSRLDVPGREREIVDSIVALAERLSLDVTGEGVETAEQLAQLRRLRCGYVQGFFLSRPVDAESISRLLREGHPFDLP